jgi:tyrosine-protein kinase Etk/Wzc
MNDNLPQAPSSQLNRFAQATKGVSAVDILENIFFFRWYLLSIFLGIFGIAIFYAFLATPIYSANALIQVQDRKGSSIAAVSQVDPTSTSPIVGEMEILASRSVIGQAISNLKGNISISVDSRLPLIGNFISSRLGKNVDGLANPLWGDGTSYSWGGEELKLLRFSVPEKSEGDPFYLKIGVDNAWTLSNDDGQVLISGNGFLQESSALGGTLTLSIESFKARPNTVFKLIVYPLESRVEGIQNALTLMESKRGSNIIKASFESYSPENAATTLNAITSAYLQQNIDRRSQEARRSLEFLDQELPRLKSKLQLAEKSLNEFRDQKKTLDVPVEITNILSQATAIEKSRAELILKRGELSLRYEPDHPTMRAIAAQIGGLNAQNAVINKQISALPEIQQEFFNKSRDVRVNSELYTSLLNNAQQLQVAKAGTTASADVVDPAIVPRKASRPNKARIVAVGALLGLVLGVLVCQLLAMLAGIVHDPKSLENRLGIPIFGILPFSPEQLVSAKNAEAALLTAIAPSGQMAEAIRSLRTAVIFSLLSKPRSKVVLVTSAVPSQGKSFISANLAYALSMLGKKVLLLEADVRRSTMKKYFTFDPQDAGLTGFLTKNMGFHEVVIKTGFENLDLLPAGPKIKNPGDYLASEVMAKLIQDCSVDYDYVLIDSPPILPIHDSRVLAQYVDLTLFIVRQELVSYTEVLESLKILDSGGAQIDGVVYNGFIPSPIRYGYGGYAYAYGYKGYRRGSYKYGYGGYRASYSDYYARPNDNPSEENPDLIKPNSMEASQVVQSSKKLDEPLRMGMLERGLEGLNQMRVKLVSWVLRNNRKDDEGDSN